MVIGLAILGTAIAFFVLGVIGADDSSIKTAEEIEMKWWDAFKGRSGDSEHRGSDYVEGLSDGAGEVARAIKGKYKT